MHNTIRVSGLFALLAVMACEEKKPTPTPTPVDTARTAPSATPSATASVAATATAAASGSAAAGDAGDAAYMANCPSATPNAKTAIKDVPEGVEVSVTGDAAGEKEIRERVKKLVATSKTQGTGQHNHGGGGKGRSGHCTIIAHNTTIEAVDVPGGSKVTVKAKAKDEVDWLRRETRERDTAAHAPGGASLGKNHLSHCPSAVEGATTKMAESKEGVVLTIVATKAEATTAIRDRVKHQVEIAKKPEPQAVDHNSQGGGGGALGRCPVVLQGETTVEAKDVEGGSQVTVKSKKPADVAALQKETKERIASMQKTK